jgi:acetyl-CoA C-acetyltransferase
MASMDRAQPLILSASRTPIGRYLGGLSGFSAVELGVIAAREAIARAQLDASEFDEAIVGNVLSAGLGQAPARQVALGAGLGPGSGALTVNMVCGSGLRAVMLASTAVRAGDADLVLAGGMESMSNAPHLLRGGRSGWKIGNRELIDSMLHDGLTCAVEGWPMGEAAERTAQVCGLTRADLDACALESQRRAVAAQAAGAFDAEIVPVPIAGKKEVTTLIRADEGPRAETTAEALARLSPAFRPDGLVTAGNSSTLSDGAAMVVVASEAKASQLGARPLARIVATAIAGLEPRDVFLAPIGAVRAVLKKAGLAPDAIDLYEINEAFAAQLVGCVRGLEIDPARVNVHGGAIALGHPIGASGARVLVTLLHALERQGKRLGLAALCLGGGNAVAMIVERIGDSPQSHKGHKE